MNRVILCIFARAPVLGGVKSRLAVELGDDVALAAHVELVQHSLARLARIEGVTSELWLDDSRHAVGRRWARRWNLPLRQQHGDDLGERMHLALCRCTSAGAAGIVVGTDCPAIDAAYVQAAVDALEHADVVLAPAVDGGYGLVGACRPVPELFRDIPWGGGSVLGHTCERAEAANLTVALLPEIWDVDTAADWRRFKSWSAASRRL